MPYPMLLGRTRAHAIFPPIVSGYRIDGLWEVVEPIGANVINLVSNPSIELDTTGYAAQGSATIAQSAEWQRRGVYSLKVTPTAAQLDGVYYSTFTAAGGSIYTLSFDLKAAGGVKYRYYIANTTNNAVSTVRSVTATGGAQRVSLTYQEPYTPGQSISRRIYITKDYSTSTQPFYIDGLCVTDTPYPVLYFDGDSIGFIIGRADFFWNGTRHASTSTMLNYTRAGGRITPLSRYGLTVLAMVGLGMQPLRNISTPQALIGGSQYQRTVSVDRLFDLVVAVTGPSLYSLQSNRRDIINLLKPDATPTDSPLLLLYTPVDECGVVIGETLEIPCVYESGLEGMADNHYQERIDLRFHSFLPFLGNSTGSHGQALGYQQVLSSGRVFVRDILGNWTRLGDGLNGSINASLLLPDGRILFGGQFTNASGDTYASYLAYYDFSTNTFSRVNTTTLSGGGATTVNELALLPDGNRVLVGGDFTNAGGIASADYLCVLDLTTGAFSAFNLTPLNALVYASAVLNNGDIIIGGEFTNAGGTSGDYITKINGSTFAFEQLNATPLDAAVLYTVKLFNGDVIFTGDFNSASGVSNIQKAGYLTVSSGAFSALNTSPFDATAYDPTVAFDARVYFGEDSLYSWNGPGAPFNVAVTTDARVFSISALLDGTIAFGGEFTTANGLTLPGRSAGWNGSSVFPLDIGTGTTNSNPSIVMPDGKLVLQASGAITGPAGYVNTMVNNGPSDAYPVIEILGPGTVYQIKNYSTGEALYFNLVLNAGERAILDLTPGRIRFGSNFRPNLLGNILPGSALATFRLVPGTNAVSVFIAGTVNSSTSITARWRDAHWAIDSAVSAP